MQYSGLNDDERNLMSGTRSFNVDGMLPWENLIADHMREYDGEAGHELHQVLVRVTPDFEGDNLFAHGVIMEADCIQCDDVDYAYYIINWEPGVTIDYRTGENWANGEDVTPPEEEDPSTLPDAVEYVLNTNSGTFHLPSCHHAESMSDANRREITAPRSWMVQQGYNPCGVCNP